MSNKKCGYYIQLDDIAEKFLRIGQFLGEGHNGIVYLLPDDKVIKIFKDKKVCESEFNILKKLLKANTFHRFTITDPTILLEAMREV